MGFIYAPRDVQLDKVVPITLDDDYEFYDFANNGAHYVAVRFDHAGHFLPESADVLIRPWSSTARQLREGRRELSFIATTAYRAAINPGAAAGQFEFSASNEVQSSYPSSYNAVGVTEANVSTMPPNTVENESAVTTDYVLRGKVQGDAFDSVRILVDGTVQMGAGAAAPLDVFRPSGGPIQVARRLLAINTSPAFSSELVTEGYVAGQIAALAPGPLTAFVLTSPWVNAEPATPRADAAWYMHNGEAKLQGRISSGSSTGSATIMSAANTTIPASRRPDITREWNIQTSTDIMVRIRVGTDGAVTLTAAPTAIWEITLDGLNWIQGR